MKRFFRPAVLVLFTTLATVFAVFAFQAQQADPAKPEFKGKVVSIADGDTVTVLTEDKTQHRIRLEHVDCPESHQDYGTKAKEALAEKIFGKEVTVKWTSRDKYKRILGIVYLGDRNMNLELVKEGWAWHYVHYSKDTAYAKAEAEAKEGKRGLWAGKNPIPPWEFRRGKGEVETVSDKKLDLAERTVYVTKSGKKYHSAGCRYLAKSKIPLSLGEAVKRYEPCSVCKPATLNVAQKTTDEKKADTEPKKGETEPKKGDDAKTVSLPIDKWEYALLEKQFPIKVKSIKFEGTPKPKFRFTVEQLNDDPDKKLNHFPKGEFLFFDDESVVLFKGKLTDLEGELTNVKGDAFRWVMTLNEADARLLSQVKKVQYRDSK
jgi:micrococcal nuclease